MEKNGNIYLIHNFSDNIEKVEKNKNAYTTAEKRTSRTG